MRTTAYFWLKKHKGHYYASAEIVGHGWETFEINRSTYYGAKIIQKLRGVFTWKRSTQSLHG